MEEHLRCLGLFHQDVIARPTTSLRRLWLWARLVLPLHQPSLPISPWDRQRRVLLRDRPKQDPHALQVPRTERACSESALRSRLLLFQKNPR